MSTEISTQTYSAEELAALQGMAQKDNVSSMPKIPALKINYDEDSKICKRGEWVVGQIKETKDGKDVIVDEGHKVEKFIILKVKNKFSLYNEDDKKKNCSSTIFNDRESVKGSNYKHTCGKGCPFRDEKADPRCSAQKVVFGIAIPSDGSKPIECAYYVKGDNYMPFVDFITKSLPEAVIGGQKVVLPYYGTMLKLGSESKTKGSLKYFIATYEKAEVLSFPNIKKMEAKADKVEELIAQLNSATSKMGSQSEARDEEPATNFSQAKTVESKVLTQEQLTQVSDVVNGLFDD